MMVFTLVEYLPYVIDVPEFIDIECNDPRSMQAYIAELEDINIYDKLEQAIDSDPQENYLIIYLNIINQMGTLILF